MNSEAQRLPDLSRVPYVRLLLGLAVASVLAAIVLLVPVLRTASLPDTATGPMIVAFGPSTSFDEAFAAILEADGLPVRRTGFGNIWIVQAPQAGFVASVKETGAVGVYRDLPIGIVLAGCTGVIARIQAAG